MSKTSVYLFVVFFAFPFIASADEGFKNFSITGNIRVKSQYVFRNGIVASDKPVAQGNITLGWQNGIYVDLWSSVKLQLGPNTKFGNEVNSTVGWFGKVGNGLKIDTGIAYFDLFPVPNLNGDDIVDFYGEVMPEKNWELGSGGNLTPFAKLEILWTPNGVVKAKSVPRVGLYHNLREGKWALNQKFDIAHYPSIRGRDTGVIVGYEVGINYAVNKNIAVGPTVKLSKPIGFNDRASQNIFGFGLRFAY